MKLIVAKDGTGDYTSLQAVVDAAPESGPAVILAKAMLDLQYGTDWHIIPNGLKHV